MKKKNESLNTQIAFQDMQQSGLAHHEQSDVYLQMLKVRLKDMESHAHPYDDAFRTLKTYFTELLLPILNEAFEENYDGTEKVQILDDHHFSGVGTKRKKYV